MSVEIKVENTPANVNVQEEQVSVAVENGSFSSKGTTNVARIGEVVLLANAWVGDASPYSQIVNIDGITENSQVDLTPTVEQLVAFYEKDLTLVAENEDGVVTVYAIGDKPQNDYTIQVTITEVKYE